MQHFNLKFIHLRIKSLFGINRVSQFFSSPSEDGGEPIQGHSFLFFRSSLSQYLYSLFLMTVVSYVSLRLISCSCLMTEDLLYWSKVVYFALGSSMILESMCSKFFLLVLRLDFTSDEPLLRGDLRVPFLLISSAGFSYSF